MVLRTIRIVLCIALFVFTAFLPVHSHEHTNNRPAAIQSVAVKAIDISGGDLKVFDISTTLRVSRSLAEELWEPSISPGLPIGPGLRTGPGDTPPPVPEPPRGVQYTAFLLCGDCAPRPGPGGPGPRGPNPRPKPNPPKGGKFFPVIDLLKTSVGDDVNVQLKNVETAIQLLGVESTQVIPNQGLGDGHSILSQGQLDAVTSAEYQQKVRGLLSSVLVN